MERGFHLTRAYDLQTRSAAQGCQRVRYRAFTHGIAADIAVVPCQISGRESAPRNRDEDETDRIAIFVRRRPGHAGDRGRELRRRAFEPPSSSAGTSAFT